MRRFLGRLQDVASILKHPRVYAFLHVPIQSASDAVLSDMKREYCVADFERVVDYLRARVPAISIATDVICGFPTETEADFVQSLDLCRRYRFPSLFINQFFPRPGTPAARLPRLPTQVRSFSECFSLNSTSHVHIQWRDSLSYPCASFSVWETRSFRIVDWNSIAKSQ